MKTTAAITLREETLQSNEDKKDRVSFNIALDPSDPDDRTKMYVVKFAAGSAEDWLKFRKEAQSIVEAKTWTSNADAQFRMYSLLLKDDVRPSLLSRYLRLGLLLPLSMLDSNI